MDARPKRLVVTSNWSLEEAFPGKEGKALQRRFKVILTGEPKTIEWSDLLKKYNIILP